MGDWTYHSEAEEQESWWGQSAQFTIGSAESAGRVLPTIGDGREFDCSVEKLLRRLT